MSMDALALPRRPGEHWHAPDGIHIEVRGLAPPGPFVAIIKLIASLNEPAPVIVHHDRDPLHLYAELAERGWLAERVDGEPGEFRLRLLRES